MTPEQFDALAQLLQLKASPSREGARLVLVDGRRQADVVREIGITRQALSQAVTAARRGLAQACVAAGVAPPQDRPKNAPTRRDATTPQAH